MKLDIYVPYRNSRKLSWWQRALKKVGPTWLSAPVRRFIQGAAFVLFLVLFFYVCWPYGSTDYAAHMAGKERIEAESFLALDPLVSLSTALAGKTWVWSLLWAGVLLAVSVLIPRGFCGYLCPLGTLIDLFDSLVGKRVTRFRVKRDGWWVHLKYYLLLGVLVASLFGVMLAGFVAAIPVITRGLQFLLAPVQMGIAGNAKDWFAGWYLIPPVNAGHFVSLALFAAVLALGLLRPRFWCRYVCPTGAVFSVANVLRASERKVESSCIDCDKCRKICPFDAINPDYSTRGADCTLCQTCAGVCPTQSIKFVERWNDDQLKAPEPDAAAVPLSRRGFLAGAACGAGIAAGIGPLLARASAASPPVRPPGSVPEDEFLQLCIRCGECFKACPNNVLQPMGFEGGLNNLWTPKVVASWSGCEPSCNNCGQVCPTGAIRALPIEEKRVARMALAVVNEQTCLPLAGQEACDLCKQECDAAGYHAIEFMRVGTQVDEEGNPIEDSGFLAPVVRPEACVGCGLCQTRCHNVNVKQRKVLKHTAIEIFAGEGKEDRLRHGSYLQLRDQERQSRQPPPATQGSQPGGATGGDDYLPDFLQ